MHRVAGFGGVGSDSIRSGSGDLISSSMHRVAGLGGVGSDNVGGDVSIISSSCHTNINNNNFNHNTMNNKNVSNDRRPGRRIVQAATPAVLAADDC